LIRFFVALFVVATAIVSMMLIIISKGLIQKPSFFFETTVLLVFSTGLIFTYLFKTAKPDFFVQLYLLTMAVKLLAYGAYNLLMILDDSAGAPLNVVYFMISYFIFTALEITFLYRKISG
jgi:hypothetical protein